jgi:transposase
MTIPVLGIDISKQKFDATLLIGEERFHRTFTNDKKGFKELQFWLKKKQVNQVHACMEATSSYAENLAWSLQNQHHTVSIVNPLRISGYAESQMARNRTDKTDSSLIADFCATQRAEAWMPLPAHIRELQSLLRHVEALQKMKQMELNRLEKLSSDKEIAASIKRTIAGLSKEIEKVEQSISNHINSNPDLKKAHELLKSIPAIADKTAAWLLGEIEFYSFENAKQVAAFVGVSPKKKESGTSVKSKTKISKVGNKRLRKALYMPSIVACRFNPAVKALCLCLEGRRKQKMQIICAAMHKLIHIAFGVVKSGRPFDKNFDKNFAFSS